MREPKEQLTSRPENGCYIYGLFIEGARWSKDEHKLAESRPKELYTDMPVMQLIPAENRKEPDSGIYVCPMYKTLTRAGMYLSLSVRWHLTVLLWPSQELAIQFCLMPVV